MLPIAIVVAIAAAIVIAVMASKGTGSVVTATNDSPVSGPAVHLEYLLDDSIGNTSEAVLLTPGFDGTVTLPEQPGEREGYAFIGWASEYPQQILQTELLKPGTKINIDDAPYAYFAVWRPLATFDGNGADEGKTDSVATDTSGNVKLPECGFSKKGYVFDGWMGSNPNELDYEVSGDPAGTTVDLYAPQTFYACWRKSIALPEISIDKAGTFNGEVAGWESSMGAAAAIVKNNSTATLEVSASFSTYGASGGKVEDVFVFAPSIMIAPGGSYLVSGRTSKRAESATYSLEAHDPFPGTAAVQNIEVKTDKATDDGIEARLVNNENNAQQITFVSFVAKDKDGFAYVGGEYVGVTLKPKEFADLSITSESLYSDGPQPNWSEMEMTFYVGGSLTDEGYWKDLLEKDLAL